MKKVNIILILTLIFSFDLHSQKSSEALFNKGVTAMEEQRFEKAEEIFSELMDKHPDNADVIMNRGIARIYLGKLEESKADLSEVIKLRPKDVNALNYRGLVSTYLGKYDEALEDFDKAIKHDKKFAEAYINRGNIYEIKSEYLKALDDYNIAEKYTKKNPMLYFQRARIMHELRKFDKAVEDFSKALNLGMNSAQLFAERGNSYFKLREYEKAIQDYSTAYKMNPDDLKSLNNRAVAYYEIGEMELAEKDKELFRSKVLEKYKPVEEIPFEQISDEAGNIKMDIPADWHFWQKINNKEEVEFYVTMNDFQNEGYYDFGGVFYLIKNASNKYGVNNETDLLLYWKEMREKQAANFTSYKYIQKKSFPVNSHPAELNVVNVTYNDKAPEVTVYEFAVAYGNNLIFAYFHTPPSEFEYYQQIYDKMIKSIHYNFPINY